MFHRMIPKVMANPIQKMRFLKTEGMPSSSVSSTSTGNVDIGKASRSCSSHCLKKRTVPNIVASTVARQPTSHQKKGRTQMTHGIISPGDRPV